jgi:APA family basic amino acid/polyamine antiporter
MIAILAHVRVPSLSTTLDASSSARAAAPARGKLLQVLGVWFGIAAAIGNTIAAGIVRSPGDIAQWLPNTFLFLSVWVVGGLYALVGAPSMAELAAAIPLSGGQYNFSRRGLGEYAGFLVGWSDWLSTCGTAAAVAIVIAEYIAAFVPPLNGKTAIFGHQFTDQQFAAVAIIAGFFVLQWRGVKWGRSTQLVTAALKTGAFVIVVAACFLFGGHARSTIVTSVALPSLGSGWPLVASFMLALQAVLYAVDGWDGVVYFGEEVRDPGREIPRAIFGSVISIMGIYLLINIAVLYVLPMDQIAGNNFSLGAAAERIFGHYGDSVIRLIMIVSLLSCINANQLFCSRTLYKMSHDGLFFRYASRVNRGGTPVPALLLSTIVGIIFVLGTFERVIAMLSFFFVANYTLSYASLLMLRKREPRMPRPYRAWGYPWTTGIALAASAMFLVASLLEDRDNAPIAFVILLLSYPLFRLLKLVSRTNPAAAIQQ